MIIFSSRNKLQNASIKKQDFASIEIARARLTCSKYIGFKKMIKTNSLKKSYTCIQCKPLTRDVCQTYKNLDKVVTIISTYDFKGDSL